MSESAEVPEKRETPEAESPNEESPSVRSPQTPPGFPDADEIGEETQDMLLELPEDELLDLPLAEGVEVTTRPEAGDGAERTDASPQTSEEDVLNLPPDDNAGDTDILSRGSLEGAESEASNDSPATRSDDAITPSAAVGADSASASAGDSSGGDATEGTPVAQETAETPILVRAPEGADVFALSELILEPSGRPLGTTVARWIGRLLEKLEEIETSSGEPDEPAIAAWIQEAVLPAIRTGEAPAEDEGGFVFAASEAAEETSVRHRLKGNGKKKSLLRELMGIVLGGLGGLLIAYYALNWFGGPQYDFANLPLPGVRHTYRHAPPWLKPYLQPGKNAEPSEEADTQSPSP
ncbi:MAG: hypothetical protein ACUVTW_02025 [Thermogutta sp.]